MCRMLGVLCNDEDLLACAIHDVKNSLRVIDGENHDGIGVGYYSNDDPLLMKRPHAKTSEIDYPSLVDDITSNVLLIHIRKATVGAWKDSNTHPFRFRKWLFAHVGHLAELESRQEEIADSLPDFLKRNIKGETDSELVFHLLLNNLYKKNQLNDLGLGAENFASHMQDCAQQIDSYYNSKTKPDYAIMATNGQIMAGVCRGIPVHYSHREGILECPLHDQSEQQLHIHGRFRSIMLGAAMSDPGHQWREVTDGSLISVTKTLELKVQQL